MRALGGNLKCPGKVKLLLMIKGLQGEEDGAEKHLGGGTDKTQHWVKPRYKGGEKSGCLPGFSCEN